MKRWLLLLIFITAFVSGCAGPDRKSTFDLIRESPAAKMLLPDGSETIVDGEIDSLRSFADLRIEASPLEPADREEDWLYRIVYNPTEKVTGAKEIVVSFHKDYLQIGPEFYLPEGEWFDLLGEADAPLTQGAYHEGGNKVLHQEHIRH